MLMGNQIRLTKDDLKAFETSQEKAIKLVRHYAEYKRQTHSDELGVSCVVSANKTIDTIIGSAEYLDVSFLMPDTVNLDKVVD